MDHLTVMGAEGPLRFDFHDLERFHNDTAFAMLAVAFRAQEVAFTELSPQAPPPRSSITVTSGHPGPGVRDAFEMVTRCLTRGAYKVDKSIAGPRLNPKADVVYAWDIAIAGKGSVHVEQRVGVLPEAFFAGINTAAAGQATEAHLKDGVALRRKLADDVMAAPLADLFEWTVTRAG